MMKSQTNRMLIHHYNTIHSLIYLISQIKANPENLNLFFAEVPSKFIKYHFYHVITILYHENNEFCVKHGNHITSSQT